MRLIVAIATRGDRDLRPLFAALNHQSLVPARIVVATQGIEPVVAAGSRDRCPVTVIHVRGAGYARGRNALLRFLTLTHASWELVAFIDDDEEPSVHWLEAHARTLEALSADVSFGPIRRRWPPSASDAVRRADLPRRPDLEEGPYDDDGRTGNCCLRLTSLVGSGVHFDEAFNVTGGEDTAFFRELRRRGARFVWSRNAEVSEELRPADCTTRAFLRRAHRNGATLPALAAYGQEPTRAGWPPMGQGKRLPKSLLLTAAGLLGGRRDLLLRGCWEASYLVGLSRALVRQRRATRHESRVGQAAS